MAELGARRELQPPAGGRFVVQRVRGHGWGFELVGADGRRLLQRDGFASPDLALEELQRIVEAARAPRVFMLAGSRAPGVCRFL